MRAVFAWLLSIVLLAAPAAADVFTVRGVEVDESASSGVEAKQVATDAGQLLAARRLFERLTLEEDRALLPQLDAAAAANLVAGYQFEEEAVTGSRFIGRMTVSFIPSAVRQVLDSYGVPYVLSTARPAVVVPVWRDQSGVWLWDNNPWLEAWTIAGTVDELVPVIAPSGDLADISVIDAQRAISLNTAALQQLAANYGSTRVLVAVAEPAAAPGQVSASMVGIEFTGGGGRTNYGSLGTGDPVQLARGAAALLQDSWKRSLAVRDPATSQASVNVRFSTLRQWNEMRTVIGNEPLIQDAREEALTNDGAQMTLTFRGRPDQLQAALREHGVDLVQAPGGGWTAMPFDGLQPAGNELGGQFLDQ